MSFINKLFDEVTIEGVNFTGREKKILFHLIRGQSAKNIGFILHRSQRTIEQQINSMKLKSDCYSKSQLIEKVVDELLIWFSQNSATDPDKKQIPNTL